MRLHNSLIRRAYGAKVRVCDNRLFLFGCEYRYTLIADIKLSLSLYLEDAHMYPKDIQLTKIAG